MAARGLLRSGVAAGVIAAVTLPSGYAASASALDVRVAQAKDFSRIEFHWSGGARYTQRRKGQELVLTFSRDANPDIAMLRALPPRWLAGAEARHVGGKLEMVLNLADGADAKVGQADGAVFVNLFEQPAKEAAQAEAPAPPPRLDPVPAGGVVRVRAEQAGGQVKLHFPWKNPAGAAVFRRGEAVWIVFDASARLDASAAPKNAPQFSKIETLRGPNWSALRIIAPKGAPVSASGEGPNWTVTFGSGAAAAPGAVAVKRDSEAAYAQLTATLAGAGPTLWLNDPVVGDRIAVVPALAPAKGLASRREYVEMALLPTLQGLVIEPYAADVQVEAAGDLVHIGRPKGLALSPFSAGRKHVDAGKDAPRAAAMPGLIDPDWSKTGEAGFMARYEALIAAAAEEAGKGPSAPAAARMALARFLVGMELSYEAIGVLNAAGKARPALMSDPEFRGLRGVAKVQAGRLKEAEADFAANVLTDDPSTALWRGYLASKAGHWAEARQRFAQGAMAHSQFSPWWKARFARAEAEAALASGDVAGAQARLGHALKERVPVAEELANRLVQARVFEAMGEKGRPLKMYAALSRAPLEQIAAPALLRATQIRLETGAVTPVQAAATFDQLRFRWRGDATELETIHLLGALYLGQGRYREALETLRSAGVRLPDLPQAVQLQTELADAFRSLFLDGLADGLEPVQALALFYDFRELTPVGAEGDLMVRKLVRRLVDVDLLPQAAELLKYQVDNRLDGVPKAQVATDLAVIYLMDRRPEQALQTINESRTTVLPHALNLERRIITARALMGLNRLEAAQEIMERDNSMEAQEVRAEIAWKQRAWPTAGAMFEKQLADRWKNPAPLRPDEEGKLLRAGVAYSLAGDDAALARLRQRYQPYFEQARNPDALNVAFSEMDGGAITRFDFNRAVADNEGFAGWVAKMKQRFRDNPAPAGPGPTKTAEAPTAARG